MTTVRVRDALRYAGKFVGFVLLAVIVAGGFIAGGAYLAADAISLTDPSISALRETPVFIGVVLFAIGVILGAIAWVALAYKFLADGIAAAMAGRSVGESAADGATSTGTDAEDPPTDDDGADTIRETGPSGTDVESTAESSVGGGAGTVTGAAAADEPGDAPPTTDPTAADSRDESDRTEQIDTEPGQGQRRADSTEGSLDEGATSSSTEQRDEPPEWTPPDPSEFERSSDGDPTGPTDQATDETTIMNAGGDNTDDAGDSMEGSATDPDAIDEDATLADEGVESFSTASDDDPLSDRLPSEDDS